MMGSALAFTGCNSTGFVLTPKAHLNQIDPLPCQIGSATKDIRIMFMVDNSGSTNTTDPNQLYRIQTIQQFIADFGAKTNLTYNFGYFSGTSTQMYDMSLNQFTPALAASPIGTSAQLSTALLAYDAIAPGGSTPYHAAFTSLQATITADENAGHKQDYAVVFMSDGQPTDIANPVAANLLGLVDSLKAAATPNGSSLTLTTVYFGPPGDSASLGNLQNMAIQGGGRFVDTNNLGAGGFVLNDVITVPGTCQ